MSTVTSVVNHWPTANEGFITTLGSTISSGAVTVTLTSVSGLTNGTIFVGIIEPGQANQQTFTGTVDTAGVQITGVKWTRGTNVDHTAGVTIVDYVSGTGQNMMTKGLLVSHDQDGTLKTGAVDVTAVLADSVVTSAKIANDTITNDDMATAVKPETNFTETTFDFVASGCVWTGDSYGVNLNASMTAGVVYLAGRRVVVSAVTARAFTASKDTYVSVDNTGTVYYQEVNNNTACPTLTAGRIWLGIIQSGATIVNSGFINQGQTNKTVPVISSVTLTVADTAGNLICPRDPNRKILCYRKYETTFSTATTSAQQITGLSAPVIVPTGRSVKISIGGRAFYTGANNVGASLSIWDGTVGSGTLLTTGISQTATATGVCPANVFAVATPTSSSKTYNASIHPNSAATATLEMAATYPGILLVELV